jgi:hypothetical protein
MMAGVTYSLTGLRSLTSILEVAPAVVREQIGRHNRDTIFAIARRAQADAPKDKGDLARSISVQGKGLNWRAGILDVSLPSRGGDNTAHLNPWVYGQWYEFGFVTRKIAAHPFMKPAVDAETPGYEAGLEQLAQQLPAALANAA